MSDTATVEPKEFSVTANGMRFHCAAQGEGPLVLLLHGFPERWFSWRHQLAVLAARGYRAVAPDLRGYGDSDRPRGGYDLRNLARDVAELIPALGAETAVVVGHDWGGAITWEAASRHPDRVSRYAVLNCPHPAVLLRSLLRSPAQLRRSWYIFFFQLPWLPERALSRDHGAAIARAFREAAVDPSRFDAAAVAPYCASAARPEDIAPMMAYYRTVFRDALDRRSARGPRADYPVIEQPGLLLWAENDVALGMDLVGPHVRYARDLRIRRIPRCGHFVQQEQPETVNALLCAWLGAAEPPS